MRSAVLLAVRAVLVAGPFALAFASGGYFAPARLGALIVTWSLVAVAMLAAPRPLPRGTAPRLAIGAAVAYAAWVWLSGGWAPLTGAADAERELALLYAGGLIASAAVFGPRRMLRLLEPLVAGGILVIVLYGLSERFLPGLVALARSQSAGGRLEQPLTYWNAVGALAAVGVVLCARMAGDRTRADALRTAAAAGAVPLCVGLYLTFSRGALAALAAGLIVLLLLAPTWSQLRACAIVLEAGVIASAAAAIAPQVRSFTPGDVSAGTQGAAVLAWVILLMAVAALTVAWAARVERQERTRLGRLWLPPHACALATVLIAALIVVPALVARSSNANENAAFGASNQRLASVGSNRYAYWKVAVRTFADHPVEGVGAGGWAVDWLRHRDIDETVRQPHSLELQTLSELGIVGLALLLTAFAAVFWAARRIQQADPAVVAGIAAALAVWGLHASIDWDWQLPAVTLVAVLLAGALLARAGAMVDEDEAADAQARHAEAQDDDERDWFGYDPVSPARS